MRKSLKPIHKAILVAAAIIVSSLLLVINRGFAYTSYSSSLVVSVTGDNAQAAISTLSGKYGLARLDRDTNKAYFQRIKTEDFNLLVTEFKESFKDAKIEVTSYLETPTPIFVVGSNQSVFVLCLLIALFIYRRYIYLKLPKQIRLRIGLGQFLATVFSLIISLGLVSFLSLFSMISEITIYLAGLGVFIAGLSYLFISSQIDLPHKSKLADFEQALNELFVPLRKQIAAVIAAVCFMIILALGVKVVLDSFILVVSTITALYLYPYLSIVSVVLKRK